MRLVLFAILLIPISGFGQTYSDFIDRAFDALKKKDYSVATATYDSAFTRFKPRHLDLYNAACSNSMKGNLRKSIELLTKAFENGYSQFDWMYYDKDLNPIRYEPAYLAFEKKYRPDSVIFFFDILRQLNTYDDVNICNRRVSLTEPVIFEYSFAEMNYRLGFELKLTSDSLIDFSNKRLEICNSILDDKSDSYNSIERMSLRELMIADCSGKLKLVDLNLNDLNFFQAAGKVNDLSWVVIDNVRTGKSTHLYAKGEEFICQNSSFTMDVPGNESHRWGLIWNLNYETMELLNTTFNSAQKDGPLYPFDFQFNDVKRLKLTNTKFNYDTRLWGNISDIAKFRDNSFPTRLDILGLKLPDFDCYLPFSQIANSSFVGFSYFENQMAIAGDSVAERSSGVFYESLTALYKRLYDHYRSRADVESANDVYVRMKDLEIQHLKSIEHRTTEETMRLRLNQLMGFYTDHATSPGKAIIISFYIVLAFGVFYCFFPSDWDKTSKANIIADFKLFIEKNEHGYIKPFFKMMKGLFVSMLNATALSMNAFITLGFGNIPTTGIARYMCIVQGLVGWFLLSLFTVALLNQVLL
jgi:hypothetical protein